MIKYIFNLTHGFRGRIILSVSTGILQVVSGLVFVAFSKKIIDIATGATEGNIGIVITGLILILITELCCSTIVNRTMELSEASMQNKLQGFYFRKMLLASWNGKEIRHSGDMLSRLTDDCRIASEALCKTLPSVLIALLQLIGAFLFLLYFLFFI